MVVIVVAFYPYILLDDNYHASALQAKMLHIVQGVYNCWRYRKSNRI